MADIPGIIIIGDHPIMLEGLAAFFVKTGRWNVKGTAASLEEAKKLLAVTHADIVLIDIQLEDGWGLDIIPWYEKEKPNDAKPVMAVYSSYDDCAHVRTAVSLGVQAYITKRRSDKELENALLKALAGEKYIDEAAHYNLAGSNSKLILLTKREMEMLTLAKQKKSNKEIAAELGISYRTVENTLSCVYDKTGVNSRYELQLL